MILAALGMVVLLTVGTDVLTTTISASSSSGWLSRAVTHGLWRIVRLLGRWNHVALRIGGLWVTLTLVLTWMLLVLTGWWLVMWGSAEVQHSQTGASGSALDALYYTGVTFSTLGNGEFLATSPVGRVATVLASTSGILLLTLSITYLIPVLNGVSSKRQLAALIHDLGKDPAAIAARLWPGGDLAANQVLVLDLSARVREVTQLHYSYPVLHYFHSGPVTTALAPNLASLDEALLVATGRGGTLPTPVHALATAIEDFLAALTGQFIRPADEPPPPPPDAGVHLPTGEGDEGRLDDHRRTMLGYVQHDGWSWDDVYPTAPGTT